MPVTEGLPRIAVLDPAVADAIAAGEVVDRPAAVVKELVENAVDAGARRILVTIEGAGQRLIEVVDDGTGIPGDDLPLAFRRHATSKIRSVSDMHAIRTLGFRGEALASIAAVACVEAISRPTGAAQGYRVLVEAGALMEQAPAGSPAGTRISVRRLFFNTPARLRFLKQPATESALMLRLSGELALGHPEVGLQVRIDGRLALTTPGTGDLRATFGAVHDPATAAAMLEVAGERVRGLVSPPALHRATRDHMVVFVNGRRIHHRRLSFAVEQAYRGLRDPDRFPLAVLDLRIDPADVDVNVHPTKREVRFRDEGAIFAALERACYHALRQSPLYQVQATGPTEGLRLRETAILSPGLVSVPTSDELPGDDLGMATPPADLSGRLPRLTFRGQVLNAYLVAEATGAMVLVDQHAAHERVLFDRLMIRMGEGSSESQLTLMPHLIDLTPAQLAAFERHREWLAGLGFRGDRFGERTLRLQGVPAEVREAAVEPLIVRLLDDLDEEVTPDLRRRETAALLACHSAVRFGDPMAPESATALLEALARTDVPISCPHGRPTTLVLPDAQLRRLFKRP